MICVWRILPYFNKIITHKFLVRALLAAQELLVLTPELVSQIHKHSVGLQLRDASTRLADCIISWRGWKQLRCVGLTEICCYGNVFKREDGHVWVSQMTSTVACHPFHRCGCVRMVTGLDLLCYPGQQETVVRAVRVAESRGEMQVQKVSRITTVICWPLGLFNPLNVGTSLGDARQIPTAVCRDSEKDVVLYKPVNGAASLFAAFTEFKQRSAGHKHTQSRWPETNSSHSCGFIHFSEQISCPLSAHNFIA
jgi:hypothetical protein